MVVYGIMPRAFPHLSDTHADWVDMSPPTFGILQIRLRGVTKPVEVVVDLAIGAMIVKMKFWNDEFEVFNKIVAQLHSQRQLRMALFEIARPLTTDVVRE